MGSKACLKMFDSCKSDLRDTVGVAETVEPPQSSEPTYDVCGLNVSKAHLPHTPPTPISQPRRIGLSKHPMRYLPHTLITSHLGCWRDTFHLQFNHLLAEDPSIAVFSTGQWAPVPRRWRRDAEHRGSLFPFRRLSCDAKVVFGSGWQYEVSEKVIRYWDLNDGIMLVDWHMLYSSYFARKKWKKNKKKVGEVVNRYRELEETTLKTVTGGAWGAWGYWNIHPTTRTEVALACKYEGRGYEDGLVPKKKMSGAQKLKTRVGNFVSVMKEALRKRLEKKRSKLGQQIEKLESYGGCGMNVTPGYQRLR
jgi:hypothetical protein